MNEKPSSILGCPGPALVQECMKCGLLVVGVLQLGCHCHANQLGHWMPVTAAALPSPASELYLLLQEQ